MLLLSPAKINIGLRVIGKRADAYHNLQSLMLPVGLCDILEISRDLPKNKGLNFSQSGINSGAQPGSNLCEKAYALLAEELDLPPVKLHLHKQIPVGAGLGGGSSNASTTLLGLNRLAGNQLRPEELHRMAAQLGSDCPFFLHREAMMMEGRGDILTPTDWMHPDLHLSLLFPGIHSSTAEAYAGITPTKPVEDQGRLLSGSVEEWKHTIVNDFEDGIFRIYPEIEKLKMALYRAGAVYAAMSGSGSAVFGLFRDKAGLPEKIKKYQIWSGKAGSIPVLI